MNFKRAFFAAGGSFLWIAAFRQGVTSTKPETKKQCFGLLASVLVLFLKFSHFFFQPFGAVGSYSGHAQIS